MICCMRFLRSDSGRIMANIHNQSRPSLLWMWRNAEAASRGLLTATDARCRRFLTGVVCCWIYWTRSNGAARGGRRPLIYCTAKCHPGNLPTRLSHIIYNTNVRVLTKRHYLTRFVTLIDFRNCYLFGRKCTAARVRFMKLFLSHHRVEPLARVGISWDMECRHISHR